MSELVTLRRRVVPARLANELRSYVEERSEDVHRAGLHIALLDYADAIDAARLLEAPVKRQRGIFSKLFERVNS